MKTIKEKIIEEFNKEFKEMFCIFPEEYVKDMKKRNLPSLIDLAEYKKATFSKDRIKQFLSMAFYTIEYETKEKMAKALRMEVKNKYDLENKEYVKCPACGRNNNDFHREDCKAWEEVRENYKAQKNNKRIDNYLKEINI